MPERTFHVHTYGCQMNERDSEIISGLLRGRGLVPAPGIEEADVVVVNTCTVRGHAEQRALSLLGRLRDWRAARPERVLVLAGCVASVRGRELRSRFPHVDVMVGPANTLELPGLIDRVWDHGIPQVAVEGGGDAVPDTADGHPGGFRAWVKIMEGCDHACSFCVVPQARGRERNRPFSDIVAETERLVGSGVVEITLLGQTVNAYGKRAGPDGDFAALLTRLAAVPGLGRLRFTSPHPVYHSDAVLRAMGDLDPVCEHMHLPVQSGSDRMLKAMRRGHTAAMYLGIVERARRIPGLAITTDLIVGFPGETEADFQATLDLVRSADLAGAFSFKYSARPGTAAAGLPDHVAEEEKEDRLARLNASLDEMSRRHNDAMVGSTADILVEAPAGADGLAQGRLRSNRIVSFDPGGVEVSPGEFQRVEIVSAATWSLSGRLVERVGSGK